MLTPSLKTWLDGGQFIQVFGHKIFTHVSGPADGPTLLILHGFPTSSHDFSLVLKTLSTRYRVICFDHVGFGLSEKPTDYSYSLFEQADIALGVWRHFGVERAHLLAHDYSTSVTTELLARRARGMLPLDLTSVTLCNGSVYIHLADLTILQRITRHPAAAPLVTLLFNEKVFNAQIRRILAEPHSLDGEVLGSMWAAVEHNDGGRVITKIQEYLDERARFLGRWSDALKATELPTHVLWARADPVSVPAIAEAVAADLPNSKLTWLEGLGHYPMVEGPTAWVDAALGFINDVEDAD